MEAEIIISYNIKKGIFSMMKNMWQYYLMQNMICSHQLKVEVIYDWSNERQCSYSKTLIHVLVTGGFCFLNNSGRLKTNGLGEYILLG